MALFVAINAKYVHTSLSVRYLQTVAGEDGKIFECSINDSITKVSEDIFKTGEKHILFSCYLWNIEMVLKISEILKKADENIIITLGGPEVSFRAEEMLKKHSFIDHIITGEGETKIKEIVKNPPDRGVYDFGVVENLDDLAFPYKKGELSTLKNRLVYYETSRGCPFSCAFCLSSAKKGVRYRSLSLVKDEIMEFINSGVRLVKLVDRTFNSDNKRALELVEFIKENSKNTSFHFEVKAETMSDELIDSLADAKEGLFQLEIGVQTTDSETLKRINRRENFDKLKSVVERLSKNKGLHLHLDLIAGLPKESFKTFKKSFNDVYMLKPHDLQLGFLKKLSGAKITDKDGVFSSFPPYEVIKTEGISYLDIVMLKDVCGVLERLYNSGVFKNTLELLEKEYETPFDMFYDFSSFYDFKESISQKRLYEVVYEFIEKKGLGEGFKNALIYDFCLCNRDCLSFMTTPSDMKQKAFSFLKDDEKVKMFFGEYIDLKPTERYKKLRFEQIGDKIFAFDPEKHKACDVTKYI